MPPYHISRSPGSSTLDPTAGIVFTPSLESDELFFSLKDAFPEGLSHGYRLRSALVSFLLDEQEAERRALGITTSEGCQRDVRKARAHTDQRYGHQTPNRSESEFAELGGVKFENANQGGEFMFSHARERARKWRRTMTPDEKKEYRQRRARGACEGCKRKKRKCTHDQELTEVEAGEGRGEGGYEGDCEVGQSPPERKEVIMPPVSETSTPGYTISEVEATAWSIAPWPTPFEEMCYDLTDTVGFQENTGLWTAPMDFPLPLTTSASLVPQNWTHNQQLYMTQTQINALIPGSISCTGALPGHDFEDETYQSSEEVEISKKVRY